MKNRILSSILLAGILLSSFNSCSDNTAETEDTQPDPSADTSAVSAETEPEETEAETVDVKAYLGERDFGGMTFSIVGNSAGHGEWLSREIVVEELTGEPMNDAIYNRNLYLEDVYNVTIALVESGSSADAMKTSTQAGTDDYQSGHVNANQAANLALNGILYDLYDLPHVDLTKPWYDQNAVDSLSINNRLYLTFADSNIQNKDLTWCVMFNKQLAENMQLEDLYDVVNRGAWTLDLVTELAHSANQDTDGNGEYNAKDQWGLCTPFDRTCLALMYSSGVTFYTSDADDIVSYKAPDDLTYSAYEKVINLYYNNQGTLNVNSLSGQWRESESLFMNNQVLFYIECMQNLERFREMEVDFGILPMPKNNEEQTFYRHMVCDFPTATVVSSAVKNPEEVGFILEAFNAKSRDTIVPAYYDISLKSKFSRDEASSKMLDIIFASQYYDPTFLMSWGLCSHVGSWAVDHVTEIASKFKSAEKLNNKKLEKTVAYYTADKQTAE